MNSETIRGGCPLNQTGTHFMNLLRRTKNFETVSIGTSKTERKNFMCRSPPPPLYRWYIYQDERTLTVGHSFGFDRYTSPAHLSHNVIDRVDSVVGKLTS